MRKLLNVDLLVGACAFGFAVTGLFVPEIASLADPKVAFSFSLVALLRGANAVTKALEE